MTERSCARCGSTNVDPDGYCWSCVDPTCAPGTSHVWGYPGIVGAPVPGAVGGQGGGTGGGSGDGGGPGTGGGFGAPGFAGPGYGGPGTVQGAGQPGLGQAGPGQPRLGQTVDQGPYGQGRQQSAGLWFGSAMIGLVAVIAVTLVTSLGVRAVNDADSAVQAMPLAMPSTEPSVSPSPAVLTGCVVGTWDVTSTEQTLQFDDFGMVTLSGTGGKLIFKADGLGQYLAEQGMTLSATLYGRTLSITSVGGWTFRYQILGGEQINYVQLSVDGNRTYVMDGQVLGSKPVQSTGATTDRFNCVGNDLWLHGNGADSRLTRVTV